MGFEKHVYREDGQVKSFTACNDFWECECPKAFYHPYQEDECPVCKAKKEDQPDARVEEMLARLNQVPQNDGALMDKAISAIKAFRAGLGVAPDTGSPIQSAILAHKIVEKFRGV